MMTNVIDKDQQWLLNCLSATLDPNQELRSFAEASLHQASLQPAISMAVASIAVYEWPENWPDLLPFVLKLISDQTNMNGVHGALRCFALLSGDLDDKMVPALVPVLFPCLLTIVSSHQVYDKYIRAKATSIVYSCASVLGAMGGVYKTESTALIGPMLKSWMDQFSIILEEPVQPEDPDDWSLRMEVLKCLNQFAQNFPSLTESQFMVIVGPLWKTFESSLTVYVRSSIEGTEDSYEGRYDSDGAEKSLDSFVIQMLEFLLTVVGSAKLVKFVANSVKEVVYHTIAFLQMTEQQVHTWSVDANQFVADEDDVTYSCRVSGLQGIKMLLWQIISNVRIIIFCGSLLLEEIVNTCGGEGIDAIMDAAKKRFNESQQQKASGSTVWWRIREATLFALASVSEQLVELQVLEVTRVDVGNLLEQIITEDIGIGVHECPFLYARIFTSIAKFTSVISHGVLEQLLNAAIRAIGMDVPPPVKVGTCRALSQLLPEANKETIRPQMMGLFSSLVDLLNQASDETLHLVLETLQAAIRADNESSASMEPIISPVILNVWALHVSDPFISIDALDVLEALKNSSGCIHPLVSRVLPYIGPILDKPQQQPDGLIAGSLDLMTMLLKDSPSDVVKAIYDVCFGAVVRIVLQSDDHSEMQNATECLAAFVSGGRQEMITWGGDSGFTMRSLLDAASRLLDPELESSGSLFVGTYILQLILHLSSEMSQHIRNLVAALVRRMQSVQIVGLRSSLLLIFARLVHMSSPNVEQFIALLVSIPAEGYDNSFAYVMSEWTKQQGEIQGAYQIKVTTSALALLLSTRHVELAKINVQHHLIKTAPGITTRSRAKFAPDQWTVVPLPVKMLALLADVLVEIQEQDLADDDEADSDWEEVQTEDIETDKDLLDSLCTTSSGRPTYGHLEAMEKIFNKDQDDYEDDQLRVVDPLNQINLAHYLGDFFVNFCQQDRQLFEKLCQNLTQSERDAIQMVLHR
ncbi:hypothetical protein I3760_05G118900 [Carya illinoinensis]|nr:hypothetical protein I3760_05G118900 [Carya illinoinensis]